MIVGETAKKIRMKYKDVSNMVEEVLETMKSHLIAGDRIELRNFGVFSVKLKKPKVGRNPRTGEVVPIPERKVVCFKVGHELKNKVKTS
jgi:nucleoid DNA-binding protein